MGNDAKLIYMRGEVDLDIPICQYMDLDYAIRILCLEKYYVKAKCAFEDAFEGRFPWEHMFAYDVYNVKPTDEEVNRRAERIERKKAEHKAMKHTLTSCWTLLNRENILMWKSYTTKMGVCIKTTVRKFVNSIECDKYDIYCGRIGYDGYGLYQDNEQFAKLNSYADERELRFYFISEEDLAVDKKYHEFKVNPKEMINEIVLSPYISESSSRCLQDLLKKEFDVRVTSSRIKVQ